MSLPWSPSSIACVLVPHFALRVAVLHHPDLDGHPLVLGSAVDERPRVRDISPEARARGIHPGLSVREATALVPELVIVPADPVREAQIADELTDRLERLSPLVEHITPGTVYVDLRGSAWTLGPPAVAARRLLAAVSPVLRPRVGIAPGKFAALIAARRTPPGRSTIVPAERVAASLAEAPAEWLPLPPETQALLRQLGLPTMSALAALPAAAVAARLGPAGRRAWLLASGRTDWEDRSIQPTKKEQAVREEIDLPHATVDRPALLRYLALLVQRACMRPEVQGRGIRRVTVRAALDGGSSWERVIALKGATGADRLEEVLQLRLGSVNLPRPATALWLELAGITTVAARQETLPGLRPQQPRTLIDAIRTLSASYGASPVYTIVGVEPWSRIPERRYALARYEP